MQLIQSLFSQHHVKNTNSQPEPVWFRIVLCLMVRKHLTTIVFLWAEIKQLIIRWNAELILLFNYGCDLNAHRCSWFTSCADSFMTHAHALSVYCKCVKSTDRQFSPLPTHFLKWCGFCYCCNVTSFLFILLVIINSIKTFIQRCRCSVPFELQFITNPSLLFIDSCGL